MHRTPMNPPLLWKTLTVRARLCVRGWWTLGLSNLAERFLLGRYELLVQQGKKIELDEIERWRGERRCGRRDARGRGGKVASDEERARGRREGRDPTTRGRGRTMARRGGGGDAVWTSNDSRPRVGTRSARERGRPRRARRGDERRRRSSRGLTFDF